MNSQNQKHIENLRRIENDGQLIQLNSNIKMQQLQNESLMNKCHHEQEMKLRSDEHDEKMVTLNSNHQQTMEKMKDKPLQLLIALDNNLQAQGRLLIDDFISNDSKKIPCGTTAAEDFDSVIIL